MYTQTAEHIYLGFRRYRTAFDEITRGARRRFQTADWLGAQKASADRLNAYKEVLGELEDEICSHIDSSTRSDMLWWSRVKKAYKALIETSGDRELAETWFNSAYRRLAGDADLNNTAMFLSPGFTSPPPPPEHAIISTYTPRNGVVAMVRAICIDHDLGLQWRDLDRDLGNVLRTLVELRPEIDTEARLSVQIIKSIFFRNKGAYLIGKLIYDDQSWPLALPLLLDRNGDLYIDTVICDEDELSIMFSFTRAYFMVDTPYPYGLVEFLADLLPNKKRYELYSSIGWSKHGKTEFFRGFIQHLAESDDQFIIAPGIKGMVMSVFILPSYQSAFKVIKDRFAYQKNITHEQVRAKYHVVKQHDRVGRMADTQEFENFVLPRKRVSDEVIAELKKVAASKITVTDEQVRIAHLYTERLMTPLNIYLKSATHTEVRSALDEYGNAIKQLAAANIFPGDMLLKNFGVTRHGRVVFYDYDEISYLTDVNFRHIPKPRTPEEEMSSEVWYTVGPNDVFPEEFPRFLFSKASIRDVFTAMHGDLFDADYWRGLQSTIRKGTVMDVFPYRRKRRFGTPSGRTH